MAEADREMVRFDNIDGIGVITNPPVNALSTGAPEGIVAALDRGNADPSAKTMVCRRGRSFIAGADIRQFGKDRAPGAGAPALRGYQ